MDIPRLQIAARGRGAGKIQYCAHCPLIDRVRQKRPATDPLVIHTQTATGLALDTGALLKVHRHLHLGAGLRNLGAMNNLDQQATDLPLGARLGAAYSGIQRLGLSAELRTAVGEAATTREASRAATPSSTMYWSTSISNLPIYLYRFSVL